MADLDARDLFGPIGIRGIRGTYLPTTETPNGTLIHVELKPVLEQIEVMKRQLNTIETKLDRLLTTVPR